MICDRKCLTPLYDRCMEWTGGDIPCLGIKQGQAYDEALQGAFDVVCEHLEERIDTSCLGDACGGEVTVSDAVRGVIKKVCSLTTADVRHSGGGLYCLGRDTMSPAALRLTNKRLSYSVSAHPTDGSTISYNLMEDLTGLGPDFVISRINSVVTGTASRGVTTIIDSDKGHVTATVRNDRFPLNARFEVYVNTPAGTVKLHKSVNLPSPQVGSHTAYFDVDDFSTAEARSYAQQEVNSLLAAELCAHRVTLDSYRYVDIADGECLKFPSKDIKDVVGVVAGGVEDLCARVTDLEEVVIKDCGECGEVSKRVTIQEAIDILADRNCEQEEQIRKLREEVESLKKLISTIK